MRDVLRLETERLILRRLRLADADRVSMFTSDPGVAHMTSSVPSPNPPIAAEGWIQILKSRAPLGEEHVFGIEARGQGLIGVIGAHKKQKGQDGRSLFEIGYWLGRPFWGRGYASEAARAFTAEARALGALEAAHFVDNPASGRVLEKAGFAYTGQVDDRFSLARGGKVLTRWMKDAGAAVQKRAEPHAAECFC
jgi:RimJ/RimL family protein N-acetyltransferase